MSEEEKQSIVKAAANTVVGGALGGMVASLTGALIGAIPGALAGVVFGALGGADAGISVGMSALAGAGVGAGIGAIVNAVPGWFAGATAGFLNTRPKQKDEQAQQMELSRERATGFVQGMNTAGLAMVADQQEALGAKMQWRSRVPAAKPEGTLFVDCVKHEPATQETTPINAR